MTVAATVQTTRLTKLLRAAERRAQLMERSSQLNEKAQKQAEDALRTERNARQEALYAVVVAVWSHRHRRAHGATLGVCLHTCGGAGGNTKR